VGGEKVDGIGDAEACILHTIEYDVRGLDGLRHKEVRRWPRDVGATSKELEAWAAQAVGHTNGTSELDAVGKW
jgi:hypothetical protein